jgi:hypothetical protein
MINIIALGRFFSGFIRQEFVRSLQKQNKNNGLGLSTEEHRAFLPNGFDSKKGVPDPDFL